MVGTVVEFAFGTVVGDGVGEVGKVVTELERWLVMVLETLVKVPSAFSFFRLWTHSAAIFRKSVSSALQ